jgi:hypothetical protein
MHLAVAGFETFVRGDRRENTETELVDTILLHMEKARTP